LGSNSKWGQTNERANTVFAAVCGDSGDDAIAMLKKPHGTPQLFISPREIWAEQSADLNVLAAMTQEVEAIATDNKDPNQRQDERT
jgi:hypothetical protein